MGKFEEFEILIPKLERMRKVTVFLPEGYEEGELRYPVLYMHDGQNLFHRESSSYGEIWEVPSAVDGRVERDPESGIIVVGIDNGGEARLDEYSPWRCPPLGRRLGGDRYKKGFGGEGDAYSDFLVENLKPLIDSAYRTKPERESTGVMGSSMGGYISIYLGTKYPDVFSKIGALSPSLGVEKERLREALLDRDRSLPMKWYLDTGTNEHDNRRKWKFNRKYVEDARMVAEMLRATGTSDNDIRFVVEEGATHNEKAWARRFPDALDWLYADDLDSSKEK
jgi:predicted alpha/beta superfamily hydrolase